MIIESEEHREILLTMINAAKFPGSILEIILGLKQAIVDAKIEKEMKDE